MACSIEFVPPSGGLFLKACRGPFGNACVGWVEPEVIPTIAARSGGYRFAQPTLHVCARFGFEESFLVTFVAPKVTKSALLQQAGPSFAGATLRYSQPAALMSRSLWSLRHSLSPAGYCVARRLEVAGEQ